MRGRRSGIEHQPAQLQNDIRTKARGFSAMRHSFRASAWWQAASALEHARRAWKFVGSVAAKWFLDARRTDFVANQLQLRALRRHDRTCRECKPVRRA